jgi:hypothetical protein
MIVQICDLNYILANVWEYGCIFIHMTNTSYTSKQKGPMKFFLTKHFHKHLKYINNKI